MAKTINYQQMKRYRALWSQVKKLLTTIGEFSEEDAEEERHNATRAALGTDKSSSDFTQKDLDSVFDHLEDYLVLLTGPINGPRRTETQPIKRLVWSIECLGLPDPYLQEISRDQFGTSDWRKLTEKQLNFFRFTAVRRSRSRKAAEVSCDDLP